MGYHDSTAGGQSDDDESLFDFGMIRIGSGDRLPIGEDSHRLVKAHSVLAEIAGRLPQIPLEFHFVSLPATCPWRLTSLRSTRGVSALIAECDRDLGSHPMLRIAIDRCLELLRRDLVKVPVRYREHDPANTLHA